VFYTWLSSLLCLCFADYPYPVKAQWGLRGGGLKVNFVCVIGAAFRARSDPKLAVLAVFRFVAHPKICVFLAVYVNQKIAHYFDPCFSAVGASVSLFEVVLRLLLYLI